MPKPTVETLIVEPLLGLHNHLTTLLKENGQLSSDSLVEQQKIAAILDSLVQIQT
jgi:hypothetical protein